MICYTITKEGVIPGIPDNLIKPADSTSMIRHARLEMTGPQRDGLDSEAVKSLGVSMLSAVSRTRLIPYKSPKKGDKPPFRRMLVAFNPTVVYQDRSAGDSSDLVIRGKEMFVVIAYPGKSLFGFVFREESVICTDRGLEMVAHADRRESDFHDKYIVTVE